jgi:hypothetical protein
MVVLPCCACTGDAEVVSRELREIPIFESDRDRLFRPAERLDRGGKEAEGFLADPAAVSLTGATNQRCEMRAAAGADHRIETAAVAAFARHLHRKAQNGRSRIVGGLVWRLVKQVALI